VLPKNEAAARLKRYFPSRSASVRAMLKIAAKVVDHPVNVIILGETGSGKDYLAEALHRAGPRRAKPFLRIDCSAIPADLFEAELFGYEPGAFTDAKTRKRGKLEEANGGTAYLDEIAALDQRLQPKLLRAIQERQFHRLGGTATITFDLRFITSTTLSLEQLSGGEVVRKDLFFRLNVVTIAVPPLRERREDIAMLARALLRERSRGSDFDDAAIGRLQEYDWPGNIRQLRNVVERAVIVAGENARIGVEALPEAFHGVEELTERAVRSRWSLEELEKNYIERVIFETGANYSESARILGISRKTLLEKRKKYGMP
jgi:DNA-binding NtrC family response regulator